MIRPVVNIGANVGAILNRMSFPNIHPDLEDSCTLRNIAPDLAAVVALVDAMPKRDRGVDLDKAFTRLRKSLTTRGRIL